MRASTAAACAALVALLALLQPAAAKPSYNSNPCAYKEDGTACYHPDVYKKCLGPATCQKYVCTPGKPTCYTDNPCKSVSCKYGKCVTANKKDGIACDTDYDKCTIEKCKKGYCVPSKTVTCATPKYFDAQCNDAPYCHPKTGKCVPSYPKKDGTECDRDYNACTTDMCSYGKCINKYNNTCADAYYDKQCQAPPKCDPKTGKCYAPKNLDDGTPCEADGDYCTTDVCSYGKCVTKYTNECKDAKYGACETAPKCDPKSGKCYSAPAPDGTDCDTDYNACTIEKCSYGKCVPKYTQDCKNVYYDKQCQSAPTCDPKTGKCYGPKNLDEGTPCEADGDYCTTDVCSYGKCVTKYTNECKDVKYGSCEYAPKCNPKTGKCYSEPMPDDTECDLDYNACTIDKCSYGKCVNKYTNDCKDMTYDKQCQSAPYCDPKTGKCYGPKNMDDGTPCEADGDYCTTDHCSYGKCVTKYTNDCSDVKYGACEYAPKCNPKTGKCYTAPMPDDTECDLDYNACTIDKCSYGKCINKYTNDCSDMKYDKQCQSAPYCDPKTGKCYGPKNMDDGTPCEADGDYCTTDHCSYGKCVTKYTNECKDAEYGACETAPKCNPKTGKCYSEPKPDGTDCDLDYNACTVDTCSYGKCINKYNNTCAHVYYDKQCQAPAYCDPKTGKCYGPKNLDEGTPCEADGDYCTTDVCSYGKCVNKYTTDCKDYKCGDCEVPKCDPKSGKCYAAPAPDGTECDADYDKCTFDKCSYGVCKPTGECKDCVKNYPVYYDKQCNKPPTCDPKTGKCLPHYAMEDGTPCEADGDKCTIDACYGGKCGLHKTNDCSDVSYDKQCQAPPKCDKYTGKCVPGKKKAAMTACYADKDSCTMDACNTEGKCVATPIPGCYHKY